MSFLVYRVQDAEGRGPWRPGFSHIWVEDRPDHDNLTPWMVEFGDVRRRHMTGMHMGCGCRTVEQLRRWFTATEYEKLATLGFQAVRMRVGRILAESDKQLVFDRVAPLREDVEPFDLYALVAP